MMKYSIDELKEIKESIPFTKLCHRNIRFKGITYAKEHGDCFIFLVNYESLSELYKSSIICVNLSVNGEFGITVNVGDNLSKHTIKCYELIKKRVAAYLTLIGLKQSW